MKAHLLDSDEPLKEGTKVVAKCGAEIPNIAFVYFFDSTRDEHGSFKYAINSLTTCMNCIARVFERPSKRYVYGLAQAQEARDESDVA